MTVFWYADKQSGNMLVVYLRAFHKCWYRPGSFLRLVKVHITRHCLARITKGIAANMEGNRMFHAEAGTVLG